MSEQDTIAVIGAGVIGAATALALAREGHQIVLLDRAEPGVAGASFGNAGHIAAEVLQPLPSPGLLFGFYRDLFRFGGTLDLAPRQALRMMPWIGAFAAAAFRRVENTPHLAPLVRPAADVWARWVEDIGRPDLLHRHGHYEIAFGARSQDRMRAHAREMAALDLSTRPITPEQLRPLQQGAKATMAAGLWFEASANVIDPLEAVRAFAAAAFACNAKFRRMDVKSLQLRGDKVEVLGDPAPLLVEGAVVCAGVRSAPLLAPFGLHAPLQAVRGYHIEMPGHPAYLDAPVVYADERIIVTPMTGRLRATSFMEFSDADAPADARKPERLRQRVRALGYACDPQGASWVGSRPVLPDYLPGIGRAPGPARLFYSIGHQHLGLTMAPISAELIADLVANRPPRIPVTAYDLRRF
jgi:D-hydroxyproline dehydrogenase